MAQSRLIKIAAALTDQFEVKTVSETEVCVTADGFGIIAILQSNPPTIAISFDLRALPTEVADICMIAARYAPLTQLEPIFFDGSKTHFGAEAYDAFETFVWGTTPIEDDGSAT